MTKYMIKNFNSIQSETTQNIYLINFLIMRKKAEQIDVDKNKKIQKQSNKKSSLQQKKLNLIKEKYLKKVENEEN